MGVMFILIGVSLVFAVGFLAAFIYSVIGGQYDDDYTPAMRILFDNKSKPTSTSSSPKK
ncbi:MAG: cbb3-type cytochrome oxidase assembly protein CcoS [Chitinophagales bacterium]|nr:cbb3-type cytochrome oxidase assembly protein CcoS [Chitinophagales bacterium]